MNFSHFLRYTFSNSTRYTYYRQFHHIKTPLLKSPSLTTVLGEDVLVKLESVQPSGSFKIRGIGNHCDLAVKKRGCSRFIASSGGNAGMAVAYVGQTLQIPVTVVVPKTTPLLMIKKIKSLGAEVCVHGDVWNEANSFACDLIEKEASQGVHAELIHPFDHQEIWQGHSTIIDEIAEQIHTKPKAIVTVVGGGGLLAGICMGMERANWFDVPVVACETIGAASLAQAITAKSLITLDNIDSIATSLGSKCVSPHIFEYILNYKQGKTIRVVPFVCTDKAAIQGCIHFANEHRVLVEPACGAGLAALLSNKWNDLELNPTEEKGSDGPIIFIACGGNIVTPELLLQWTNQF